MASRPPFKHDPPFTKGMDPKPHRLKGNAWTMLRRRHIMHYPWCDACGAIGAEVHHIVPRSIDPARTLDPSNLRTLCKACHASMHKHS